MSTCWRCGKELPPGPAVPASQRCPDTLPPIDLTAEMRREHHALRARFLAGFGPHCGADPALKLLPWAFVVGILAGFVIGFCLGGIKP